VKTSVVTLSKATVRQKRNAFIRFCSERSLHCRFVRKVLLSGANSSRLPRQALDTYTHTERMRSDERVC
jgi:hypothetical protein